MFADTVEVASAHAAELFEISVAITVQQPKLSSEEK